MYRLTRRGPVTASVFTITTFFFTIFFTVGMFSTLVQAEEQSDEIEIEEVVVTGSRIHRTNQVSLSPVTQVDAEELIFQGTVRVEDMARTLPQVYSDQNTSQSNGATGTATLNLRNLGANRTLVLVNGRRLPAGSPIGGGIGADINQIPGALIRRVEVLTGGASATYGSDAVAGVVNFLMEDDFHGVRFDYQVSQYQHNNDSSHWQRIVTDSGYEVASGSVTDGDMSYMSLTVGGNLDDGRGNVTAYLTYRDIDPVLQSGRDYSSCALSDDITFCFGSSTIPQGRITDFGIHGDDSFDYIVQGNEFVQRNGETFNFGPLNYFQRPDEQWSFGTFAHYSVSDQTEVYSEVMIMDDRTVSQIAPSGAFFVTETLNCANGFLSAQQFEAVCGSFGLTIDDSQDLYIGRRNVEGGNRQQDLRHTSFRAVVGMRGEFNANWRFDGSVLYSEVSMENTYLKDLGTTKIRRALDAMRDPDTGEVVCRSVLDGSDPACVPWNVFETGGVTQEALDYIVLPLFARGTTDQMVVSAHLEGDLSDYGVRLPSADTGIAVILGAEYREENLDFNPDEGFRNGEGAGQGGATKPVSGGYSLTELFFEANIPILEARQYVEELTLDLGVRYTEYDYGETVGTFGVRTGWAINQEVKFRGSFQHAIRGAHVRELFLPQGFNLFEMTGDPCGGPVTNGMTEEGRTLEECARSGVTEAQFGHISHSPAAQYNFLQGGNPNLVPEVADTVSFGVLYSPDFLDGLSMTLDYFNIKIEEGISGLTPEFILNECLDGDQAQCELVHRGIPGDLWIGSNLATSGHIVALQDNLAVEEVDGIDFIADYSFNVGSMGSVQISNVLSRILTWDQQELAGAPAEQCAGKWGQVCGYPTPELRNKMRAIWTTPWNVTASLLWRYTSSIDYLEENSNIDLESVSYVDLSGIWDVTDHFQARIGINNLFDVAPPIAGNGAGPSNNGNGNTFPGMYDALGRYWFVAGNLAF